ncbi:MAG: DUF1648 domain-containing protein [Candidatus Paceibacterota bacterium]|jgi:uncharacterized membrane protein
MKYIPLISIVTSIIIGLYFYPLLPAEVASHWGASGEVNGYMSKFWGVFLMPIISIILYAIFIIVPKIDPKKANIEKFRNTFDRFIAVLFVFLLYIYTLTIMWNAGFVFNMTTWLLPSLSPVFFAAGDLIGKSEPNWTIGIRTPWTLSNEEVWRKTHALGGKLFKWIAIFPILGAFFSGAMVFWLVIASILIVSIFLVLYSYLVFKKGISS